MAQPSWITPAGSLGVVPEGIFYQIPLAANAGADDVYFQLIAGVLPAGIQITRNGLVQGIPKNSLVVQGTPTEVSRDVTSQFAIRAYTQQLINGKYVINRLADRTFTLTVTGNNVPTFITPGGNIGTYYDGSEVSTQILFSDSDLDDQVVVRLLSGQLPPGLLLTQKGLIAGAIKPLVGPPGTALPGYDVTAKDIYPNDFTLRSTSKNYQFTLEVTDGKTSNTRTFEIFVYSKNSMSADTTDFTADNTFITADIIPTRTPILLNPPGDLGRIRADNYFAYKFNSLDFDGDAVEYSISLGTGVGYDAGIFDETDVGFDRGTFSLPPGLNIDPDTGWFYGYIPDQGATEYTYRFAIQVFKRDYPTIISGFYYFTITIIGNIETEVRWITGSNLGTINNGAISTLAVEAVNSGNRTLQYRLVSGSNSKLPQGLSLLPSGHIVGRVSFNTFALDGGTTTFDTNPETRITASPTTFDLTFNFDVDAYAPVTRQLGYSVQSILITGGGSGYATQPTITISSPGNVADAIQATAGVATIVGGVITAIEVGNPGRGYTSPPTINITGGGGSSATAICQMIENTLVNSVSVVRRFTVTVNRAFNQPYETLYIKAMPPVQDRALLTQLLQNQDIIPQNILYRADDTNFGIASNIIYPHAFGLTAATLDEYVSSLYLNHYWKNLVLGEIKTARALDSAGNVLYEVVYSEIVDNLVNSAGTSVGKSVKLPYPVTNDNGDEVSVVYPNSLINMRDQVIDTVGQVSPALPIWMLSKQANGTVLGFVPAWVMAYVLPGEANRVIYNINQQFKQKLNIIDFKVDRYELDRSQTHNWDSVTDSWIPSPPESTTFDENTTIFDMGSVTFNSPADRWTNTDEFDKYLVFPKTNILG